LCADRHHGDVGLRVVPDTLQELHQFGRTLLVSVF
jgi:hypothetical protein